MDNRVQQVSSDTVVFAPGKQKSLYVNLALCMFKQAQGAFSITEQNLIKGSLRRGELSIAWSPLVAEKLAAAKLDGSMDRRSFAALYQFYSFCKKRPVKGDDELCRQNGYAKLKAGEASCKVTNMTIDSRVSSNRDIFNRVKNIIEDVLGDIPYNFLTSADIFFGPGSTVNMNSRSFEETATFFKLTDRLIVPDRAKKYLAALLSAHPNWMTQLGTHYHTQKHYNETYMQYEMRVFSHHLHIVEDSFPSRIGFVPKDSEEHRAIGIEINGLIPLQKIVGDMIRSRLKAVGINLDSQKRNRHLAKQAKLFKLATIDLANASSSISLELVRALFPREWLILLETFRSTHGKCHGEDEVIEYEMISSMGNGFTFELESLIFYALAKATAEDEGLCDLEIKRSISVYGDDIIVPQSISSVFMQHLTLFGFTANKSKSFLEGFFFESCGADYYDGYDVRPFFLKRDIHTLKDCYFFLNSLLFKVISCEAVHLFSCYEYLFKRISALSDFGPLHFENVGGRLSCDDLEAVLRVPLEYAQANGGVKFNSHLHCWVYDRYLRISVEAPLSQNQQYAVRHARYMTFLKGNLAGKVLLRGRTRTIKKRAYTSQWDGILSIKVLRRVKLLFDCL